MSNSLYLKHYGVRRHNRREEKIAKAQAKGDKKKVSRLKAQRTKVESYRNGDSFGEDVSRAVDAYMARKVSINTSSLAAGMLSGRRGRAFVNREANAKRLANAAKLGSDILNIAEAKVTRRTKSKKPRR